MKRFILTGTFSHRNLISFGEDLGHESALYFAIFVDLA